MIAANTCVQRNARFSHSLTSKFIELLDLRWGANVAESRRMRAIERILDQLNRAWGGPSWTGVAIRPLLDDLTDAQARSHPVPSAHSIIELVAHMSVWMDAVAIRLIP